MKAITKFVLVLVSSFVYLAANAQAPIKSYCQVKSDDRGVYSVVFDHNVDSSGLGHGKYQLTDEKGESIPSFTPVAAVNYLAKLGWKVVSSSVCQSGNGLSFTYFYLLEKTAESTYDIREGIYTKEK